MRVITAPDYIYPKNNEQLLFLAGGIQKCSEWQNEIIHELDKLDLPDLVICNPRRENFPIGNPNAAEEQIEWEFDALNDCDIFSMYFDESESDQPICMYELGRHLVRMQMKFPNDWMHRIVITANPKYKRYQDVIIQTKFATATSNKVIIHNTLEEHVKAIKNSYEYIRRY